MTAILMNYDMCFTSLPGSNKHSSVLAKFAPSMPIWREVLFLPVEPQILPFAFPEEVEEGQLIQVSCAVTKGDDPLTLQWYKDGTPLVSSPSFLINNVAPKLSILLLSSANANHTGTYSCLAFNPIGTAESSASLRVKGT